MIDSQPQPERDQGPISRVVPSGAEVSGQLYPDEQEPDVWVYLEDTDEVLCLECGSDDPPNHEVECPNDVVTP